MTAMVDELLDVARLMAGQRLELQREPVYLVALARRVVAEQRRRAPAHTIMLDTDHPDVVGEWDVRRIERVLVNLLDNAVKYSPDGGAIEVGIAELEEDGQAQLELTVRDHGLGVPQEHLPHIFERLYQGHTMSYSPGMGLGLYVARQIVQLHGGSIHAESPRDGGARFVVRLPR